MSSVNLADNNHCTGCGACVNICPNSAIMMIPNDEGFITPKIDTTVCINCGLCEKHCPVLVKKENTNGEQPEIYAVRADDSIREKSSSGGFFSLVAEWIIQQDGIVCGAAFDKNFQLHHIVVDNVADLDLLRGSKYLQSNVGNIYNQVKNTLKDNRKVLFTGTPCQVAALYNITGQDENLYTIDILCHGVPSQEIFNRYLSEISDGRTVKSINFRSKEFGWVCNHIKIDFLNGESYIGTDKEDAYEKGFLQNLFLRLSCSNCSFCELPRWANITMGDFWGISKIDSSQNDGKGTSLVLINNEKGEYIFNGIKGTIQYKKIDVEPQNMPNRFHAFYAANRNRERFFNLVKYKKIVDAVPMALEGKYDIGLVSNYCAPNFGGQLTHYALYHTLEDMGYSTLILKIPIVTIEQERIYQNTFEETCIEPLYKENALSKEYYTSLEMKELNKICEQFVVGSDQLFQYVLYNLFDRMVSLNWVESYKKKIAIAASFGHDYIFGDADVHADMAYWLSRYDYFSVREASGVDICRNYYGIDAVQILDPVFLVDKKHYDNLTQKVKNVFPEKYIGFYILDPNIEKGNVIRTLKKLLDIDTVGYSEFGAKEKYTAALYECNIENYKTEERLKIIMDCDFFVTDSFHGTSLAIIMNKPFITFLNKKRGESRFHSILKLFGLENRLVTSFEEFE